MRFHGLMVLRDEQDIIVQNLAHVLGWADTVFLLDLGSTDQTWDLVRDLARADKRIVPFKQVPWIFSDNFRGVLFDQFRDQFDPGDWVLRLDADEFYHITPPRFVEQWLRPLDTAVWLQWYYFRLTRQEVDEYESGRVDILRDRQQPIEERRRYYKVSEYAEPRMFRYRRSMKWPETTSFPYNAGFVSRHRIPIRHYPHRDMLQMESRFRLRARMMMLKAQAGGHWKLDDWRAEVVDATGVADAAKGNKRGLSGETGIDTGALHYWEPGTPLKQEPLPYSCSFPQRVMQRIVHPMLLPILDSRRPTFDRSYKPELIPAEIQQSLEQQSAT